MALVPRIGGSFAPPLTDEKIASYKTLAESASGPIKDAMLVMLKCCENWWNLPESTNGNRRPHPVGIGIIQALDTEHVKALDNDIPWQHEIDSIQVLLESISAETHRDLRNAAFHLLWHVKELNHDREPLTADKL